MKKLVLYRSEEHVDFSFGWFSVFVILQTVVWFALIHYPLRWIWPDIWQRQLDSGLLTFLGCFALFHFFFSFVEFMFHRYVLHSVFWSALVNLSRKHKTHHKLTHVREHIPTEHHNLPVQVRNHYPIVKPEQIESSAFPGYTLVTFWGLFTPMILVLQAAFPTLPLIISGYLAVTWSFALYEIKHAIEHLDYDKFWKGPVNRSRFIRNLYGFHLMHHSRIRVNQAIGGFFGIPIPDLLFRTYFVPNELPLPGALVTPESQQPPPPCRFIRWLDDKVDQANRRIIAKQKADALKRFKG